MHAGAHATHDAHAATWHLRNVGPRAVAHKGRVVLLDDIGQRDGGGEVVYAPDAPRRAATLFDDFD